MPERITITRFLVSEQRRLGKTGHFTALISDIVTACKMISSEVNRGALAGNHGFAGSENVQGEEQKKLDVLANDLFMNMNTFGGNYIGMASEEIDDVHVISEGVSNDYLLLFDPLDGSSNIDVNIAAASDDVRELSIATVRSRLPWMTKVGHAGRGSGSCVSASSMKPQWIGVGLPRASGKGNAPWSRHCAIALAPSRAGQRCTMSTPGHNNTRAVTLGLCCAYKAAM